MAAALVLLVVLLGLLPQEGRAGDLVCIDREGGTAFRHSDELRPIDPYTRRLLTMAGFMQARRARANGVVEPAELIFGEQEIRHFSHVPPPQDQRSLAEIVSSLGAGACQPEAATASPDRTMLRSGAGRILVVRHDGRISGLCIGSGIPEAMAERVLQSFEVLAPAARPGAPRATAREAACRNGMIILPDGTMKRRPLVARATTWAEALEIESRHYQIRGTAPIEDMATLAVHLDGMREALRSWLPLPGEPVGKGQVVVFKTAAEFIEATGGRIPVGADGNPAQEGLFIPGADLAMTFSDRAGHSVGNLRLRASHEAIHQYLHGFARRPIPRFFDEGCAVLFEMGTVQGAAYHLAMPEARLRLLQAAYRQAGGKVLAPFADHLADSVPYSMNQYGEAWAMLRVLAVPAPAGASAPGITAAWRQLSGQDEGGDLAEALLVGYRTAGGDAATAIKAWEADVLRLVERGVWKDLVRITIP